MDGLTIEQIADIPERERIALIYRLALFSDKKLLAKDIKRVLEIAHSAEYLQTALDSTRTDVAS